MGGDDRRAPTGSRSRQSRKAHQAPSGHHVLGSLGKDFEREQGDVIRGLVGALPGCELAQQGGEAVLEAGGSGLEQGGSEAFRAELLALVVEGFDGAVGVEVQAVARGEFELVFDVGLVGEADGVALGAGDDGVA